MLPLFLLGLLNFLQSHSETISVLENRTLKTKPVITIDQFFSGAYCREYEEYFADNFIFREKFVKFSGKIKACYGLPGKDTVAIVLNKGANVAASPGEDTSSPQGNMEGKVFVFNDRAMEIHTFNPEAAEDYAGFINQLQNKLADEQIKIYSLLAPTQIEFLNEAKYQNLSSPQGDTIAYVNQHLDPRIIPVDAYAALKQNCTQYLYFRSDHHWTALGAYYAYCALMNTKAEEPLPLAEYTVEQVFPYLGSLYSTTLSPQIRANPDTVFLYRPPIKYQYWVYYDDPIEIDLWEMRFADEKNKYGIFLGGDHPWGKISTEIKNGKTTLVIKDSYANAFIPFLLPHYEEIYLLDPRQFDLEFLPFIRENKIQEILFLNYVLVTDDCGFTDTLRQMAAF